MIDLPEVTEWREGSSAFYVSRSRGASPKTLVRRVMYGGRKGRRARQRLAQLPLLTITWAVKAWATESGPSERPESSNNRPTPLARGISSA